MGERIELDRGDKGLGFNIKGGTDQQHIRSDDGIFVTKIRDDGAAAVDGRLQKGDRILEINGTDVRKVQHKEAVDLFLSAGNKVTLVVQHGAEQAALEAAKKVEQPPKKSEPVDKSEDGNSKWILGVTFTVVGLIAVAGTLAFIYKKRMK
ncbi:Synaptojanin-2-binding protein [Holothuria leucospilota]|uniref:Synaptojanin-2-binding protein n=1 Tax=Holothuria leucospilota TaxID=206669 RepID=A0A9Q1CIX9_HOLLE|nr:Synaptojanin-2-binding protein [Holothuria leucospilota]